MTILPNPFESVAPPPTDDPAAASVSPPPAAAGSPRFVLDEAKFMADIEELPAFIRAPRNEYLLAVKRGAA
jgi:hypothetical protein